MKSAVKVWRERQERYEKLDKVGKVVSWTKVDGRLIAIIKFEDKSRTVGELADREIKTGNEVVGILRRLGKGEKKEVIEYGVKWKKL